MKKLVSIVAVGAAVVGLGLVGTSAASATTLYNDNNYAGSTFSGTSAPNVGKLNDLASSVKGSGSVTYFEDSGYLGRTVTLSGNYNSLGAIATNLHFGETWSDRISSFH